MWPRYYFDFERAKLEIEAWLKERKQFTEQSVWTGPYDPLAHTKKEETDGDR